MTDLRTLLNSSKHHEVPFAAFDLPTLHVSLASLQSLSHRRTLMTLIDSTSFCAIGFIPRGVKREGGDLIGAVVMAADTAMTLREG